MNDFYNTITIMILVIHPVQKSRHVIITNIRYSLDRSSAESIEGPSCVENEPRNKKKRKKKEKTK
jgi:hypothetical protein